jgi:hypothetical protein
VSTLSKHAAAAVRGERINECRVDLLVCRQNDAFFQFLHCNRIQWCMCETATATATAAATATVTSQTAIIVRARFDHVPTQFVQVIALQKARLRFVIRLFFVVLLLLFGDDDERERPRLFLLLLIMLLSEERDCDVFPSSVSLVMAKLES